MLDKIPTEIKEIWGRKDSRVKMGTAMTQRHKLTALLKSSETNEKRIKRPVNTSSEHTNTHKQPATNKQIYQW